MDIQRLANDIAFMILKVRGELTTFENFKARCKFKLTSAWNEDMFNKLVEESKGQDITALRNHLDAMLNKGQNTESDFVKDAPIVVAGSKTFNLKIGKNTIKLVLNVDPIKNHFSISDNKNHMILMNGSVNDGNYEIKFVSDFAFYISDDLKDVIHKYFNPTKCVMLPIQATIRDYMLDHFGLKVDHSTDFLSSQRNWDTGRGVQQADVVDTMLGSVFTFSHYEGECLAISDNEMSLEAYRKNIIIDTEIRLYPSNPDHAETIRLIESLDDLDEVAIDIETQMKYRSLPEPYRSKAMEILHQILE